MKIITLAPHADGSVEWPLLDKEKRSVVTIGSFDGVHKGHHAIISRVADLACKQGSFSVIIMFDPRPSYVHAREKARIAEQGQDSTASRDDQALSSVSQRCEWIEGMGVDYLIIVTYTLPFANQTYVNFLGQLVGKLGMRTLVLGHDARLGRGLAGDMKAMKNLASATGVFEVESVDDQGQEDVWIPQKIVYEVPQGHGEPADPLEGMTKSERRAWTKKHGMKRARRWSSSFVRYALSTGRMGDAASVLGRFPQIRGLVVHGEQRGRTLGYPTANLGGLIEGFIPVDGVYAGFVTDQDDSNPHRIPAAISIGTKETFVDEIGQEHLKRVVESYLVDQDGIDIYNHHIKVEFGLYMRPQVRFKDAQALVDQLKNDEKETRTWAESYLSQKAA